MRKKKRKKKKKEKNTNSHPGLPYINQTIRLHKLFSVKS